MSKKKKPAHVTEAVGPNRFPEAVTEEQKAQAAASCRYLGRNFPPGAKICHENYVWECSGGQWVNTRQLCPGVD